MSRSSAVVRSLVCCLAIVVLGGCGQGGPPAAHVEGSGGSGHGPTPTTTNAPASDGSDQVYGVATVIQVKGDVPQMCLGDDVLDSLPPQCTGVPLVGWSWPKGSARLKDTRWGEYVVVGSYDGATLHVTRALSTKGYQGPRPTDPGDSPDLSSACPTPAGGWQPADPTRTTGTTQRQTLRAARQLAGFADEWIDDPQQRDVGASYTSDPLKIILNVAVTKDRAGAERKMRDIWGGALCVSLAKHTHHELARITSALRRTHGVLGVTPSRGHVGLLVAFDDGSLQQTLNQRYGKGSVNVSSALQPAPKSLASG
jgi:hypothetical protein